jgi:hypothetical protein
MRVHSKRARRAGRDPDEAPEITTQWVAQADLYHGKKRVRRGSSMKAPNLKRMPSLHSDAAAERFVAKADLTEYELSGLKPVRFEVEPKSAVLKPPRVPSKR